MPLTSSLACSVWAVRAPDMARLQGQNNTGIDTGCIWQSNTAIDINDIT